MPPTSVSKRASPSVTMSSPARSWSRRLVPTASVYCSRNRASAIASLNGRAARFSVYHVGRGSDPVMVAGSSKSFVALIIGGYYSLSMTMRRFLLAGLVLALGLGAGAPRPAARGSQLPSRLSDRDFWRLVVDSSEPDGYFRSDNLTSNELLYQRVIPDLLRRTRPGDV